MLSSGCHSSSPAPEVAGAASEVAPLAVEVGRVAEETWPNTIRAQGSLMADETTVIGAKVAGRVGKVEVDVGDVVTTGSPLVHIDRTEFELRVRQAEAQYAAARAVVGLKPGAPVETLNRENAPPVRQERALLEEANANVERLRRLQSQNAVSAAEVEQAVAAQGVAEAKLASALNAVDEKIALIGIRLAELQLAQQELAETTLSAPYDGVVERRHVSPGTYVQIGDAMVTVVRADPLRYRGTVPERVAERVRIGQTVRIPLGVPATIHEARVTRVSPILDPASRSLTFEAEVPNPELKIQAGQFAEAQVIVDQDARSLTVPASAVTEFAGVEKVWVVADDDLSSERRVVTGRRERGRIEILDGLEPGEQIILQGGEGKIGRIQRAKPEPELEIGG